MKACIGCNVVKEESAFPAGRNRCRVCRNGDVKKWRQKYPEKSSALCRAYEQKNKAWRLANPHYELRRKAAA